MKALRNLYITLRSMPVVTGLNIFGLAVAISVAYMIFVQVNHELGFNKGIKDAARTALIISDGDFMGERTINTNMSRGAVEFIRNSVPMVEKVGSINILGNRRGGCTEDNPEGFLFNVSNILYPATTLEMFGFEIVDGDTASLATYGNMAVSESFARRHNLKLGSRIGHTYNEDIPLYNEAYWKGTITAIYRDFPENCDLATLDAIGNFDRNDISDWSNWNFQVYVKLADGYTFAQFDSTLTKLFVEEQARIKRDGDPKRYFTLPVSELYYNQPAEIKYSFPSSKGDLSTTLSLAAIAVVLLLVAFINYLNFVMSLIPIRTRSVNTQRIMGASVESLRIDFIAESFLFLLAAVVPALFIVAVVGKSDLSSLFITSVDIAEHWGVMLGIIVAGTLLSLLVSLYPAFYITSFSPAFALNGNFGRGRKGIALRTLLIGVQFFVCFVLIVAALFIWLQNRYLMSADMGFNREHLLTVELPNRQYSFEGQTSRDEFTAKLMQGSYVKDVAFSNGEFIANRRWTVGRTINGPLPENVSRNINFSPFQVSWNFLRVMGVEIVDGRGFSLEDMQSASGGFVFTEAAKAQYHLTTDNSVAPRGTDVPIVGFCRNVNARSLHEQQGAFAFYCMGQDEMGVPGKKFYAMCNLYIRLVAGVDVDEAVEHIRKSIVDYFPGIAPASFDVEFFDDVLRRQYEREQRLAMMVGLFAAVVIIVSLMGLFAAVLFEVKFMEREIALRRINGAMVANILKMINLKYVKVVLMGYLFALPLSYVVVNGWLEAFAYRIELYRWVFAAAFVVVLMVVVLVVTFTAWRVANSNPLDILGKGD